jgi:hypothetical protein
MFKKSLFVFFVILNFTLAFSQETTNPDRTPPPLGSLTMTGNGVTIFSGDMDPEVADNTDFGTTTISNSIAKIYLIGNEGMDDVVLTGNPVIRIVGADSAHFSVTLSPNITTMAAYGGSSQSSFEITFTPDSERTFEAIIEIDTFIYNISRTYSFAIKAVASMPMSVEETTAIDKQIKVYQDAISNTVTIHTENNVPIKNIRVFDVSGKLIQTKKRESAVNDHKVNFSSSSNGMYFLSIETATSKVVKKIVI